MSHLVVWGRSGDDGGVDDGLSEQAGGAVAGPSKGDIERAARTLRDGGLVAFPTETVYGLGADASNPAAVRHLYEVKGRPAGHPVIVHIGAGADLDQWALDVPPAARLLAGACWPGALTLVLRRRPEQVVDAVTGGLGTVGLRVPDHRVALALLAEFGGGIAAPSANRFGRVSPTTARDVAADLGSDVDAILDGGPCAVGVESTIVDCTGTDPVVLRVGGVTEERLAEILGGAPGRRTGGEVAAPGTLASHYAPEARVVVCSEEQVADRAAVLVAGGARVGVLAINTPPGLPEEALVLAAPSGAEEYARVLYSRLREADSAALDVLLAVPPTEAGIGAAVADRLRRASAR